MIYKVSKRYLRGSETGIGNFKTLSEAQQTVQTHLADDKSNKVLATYCIYEGMDLIEEIDQSKLVTNADTKKEENDENSQSIGQGQRFSPSPFSTKPQPKGMPQSSWKEDSSDENETEK